MIVCYYVLVFLSTSVIFSIVDMNISLLDIVIDGFP